MSRTLSKKTHPSFGVIQVSRVSLGEGHYMCGTDMQPNNLIRIRILPNATEEIDEFMGRNVFPTHGTFKDMVELEMTYSQWSNLICNMNVGDGQPCNILKFGQGDVEQYKEDSESEFEALHKKVIGDLKSQHENFQKSNDKISELIKKLPKKDQVEILKELRSLEHSVTDHIPFMVDRVNEAITGIVSRAKSEIGHYMDSAVHSLGLEAMNQQNHKLLGNTFDITKI